MKWGVGRKEDGGTVTLMTRKTPLGAEITVSDDGVGFDPAAAAGRKGTRGTSARPRPLTDGLRCKADDAEQNRARHAHAGADSVQL